MDPELGLYGIIAYMVGIKISELRLQGAHSFNCRMFGKGVQGPLLRLSDLFWELSMLCGPSSGTQNIGDQE